MEKKKKKANFFKRIQPYVMPPVWMIIVAVIFSFIDTFVGLAIPLVTKELIDVFTFESLNIQLIGLLIIAFVAQAVASGLSIYLLAYIGQYVVARLRQLLWNQLIELPVRFYDKHRSNEMVSRMINDTAILKGLITNHLIHFFTGIISMIGAVIILLFIDWQMTLVLFIAVPLMIAILMPLGKRMRLISKGLQDKTATFTAYMTQILGEIRLVKVSNAEQNERVHATEQIDSLFQYGKREGKVQAMISPVVSFVMMALLVVIIGFGGMRVATGHITPGGLVAFILYMFQIMLPLAQFSQFFTEWQKAKGATERIESILDESIEHIEQGQSLANIDDFTITVNNLSFQYDEANPVLKNVHFQAKEGTVTAIVGPSGSGKTTFFSLLEQFYEPDDGEIFIGQIPILQIEKRAWRKLIGYVPQENPILAGTILYNLTFGMEEIPPDAVINQALERAHAKEFVAQLPDGLHTEVGEKGIKLSGGQRQRIGIARAILRNPSILLLDEATSSLDAESERVVQQALENVMQGRTTFIIAHRLSTVKEADQIVFLDKGVVTGIGDHESLQKTHPLYRQFTEQQMA